MYDAPQLIEMARVRGISMRALFRELNISPGKGNGIINRWRNPIPALKNGKVAISRMKSQQPTKKTSEVSKQFAVVLCGKVIEEFRNKHAANMSLPKYEGAYVIDRLTGDIIFGFPE